MNQHRYAINSIFIYLGGLFLFAGLNVYTATNWLTFSDGIKISITLGMGIFLYLIGFFLLNLEKLKRFGVIFYLMSAVQLVVGSYVLSSQLGFLKIDVLSKDLLDTNELYNMVTLNSIVIFAALLTLNAITYIFRRQEIVAVTVLFFTIFLTNNILNYFDARAYIIAISVGVILLGSMFLLMNSAFIRSNPIWNFFGCLNLYYGIGVLFDNYNIELVFFIVSGFIIFLSYLERSATLLYISGVAIVLYVFYLSSDYIRSIVGWPLTLILFGIMLIVVSLLLNLVPNRFKELQTD